MQQPMGRIGWFSAAMAVVLLLLGLAAAITIGSFGLFFFMFSLFVRFLPMVAMAEVKGVLPQADPHHDEPSRPHIERSGEPVGAGAD